MKNPLSFLIPNEKDRAIIKKLNFKHQGIWVATFFGAGLLRPAPGTWGSLAAIPFAIWFLNTGGLFLLAIATFLAIFFGTWGAAVFERQTGDHDSKMIVSDEVAGQWLALWPAAWFTYHEVYPYLFVAGFLLFRFFDITKIPPASYFDKNIKNAVGVMMDDLVAGLYAAVTLGVVLYVAFG